MYDFPASTMFWDCPICGERLTEAWFDGLGLDKDYIHKKLLEMIVTGQRMDHVKFEHLAQHIKELSLFKEESDCISARC